MTLPDPDLSKPHCLWCGKEIPTGEFCSSACREENEAFDAGLPEDLTKP